MSPALEPLIAELSSYPWHWITNTVDTSHWGVPASAGAQWAVLAHLYRLNGKFEQMQVLESCCLLKICMNSFLELPLWYHRSSKYFFRTKNTHPFLQRISWQKHNLIKLPASLALSTITCKTDVVIYQVWKKSYSIKQLFCICSWR